MGKRLWAAWLSVFLACSPASRVLAQPQLPLTPMLGELRTADHDRYLQSGTATITGQNIFKSPEGYLLSRCGAPDSILLFPDTQYFRNLLAADLAGQHAQPSDADRDLLQRLIRETACDANSRFTFEYLPALPFMAITHTVVTIGSREYNLLRFVTAEEGKTVTADLNERSITSAAQIRTAPPASIAAASDAVAVAKRDSKSILEELQNQALGAFQRRALQATLDAVNNGDGRGAADAFMQYLDGCNISEQCFRMSIQRIQSMMEQRVPALLFWGIVSGSVAGEIAVYGKATNTESIILRFANSFIKSSGGNQSVSQFFSKVFRDGAKKIPDDLPIEGRAENGVGWKWIDNYGNSIRIMKGDPDSPQPWQRVDYVKISYGGKVVGRGGVTQPNSKCLSGNMLGELNRL